MDAKMEVNYLYEAVPLLDRYLESKEVFWQLPGIALDPGYAFSTLTIGVVLFMLKRLKARSLPEKLAAERGDYETRIFQSRIHNERAWTKKVGQDLGNRTRMWQKTLEELNTDRLAVLAAYSSTVAQRVIMQLLWEEIEPAGLLAAPLKFTLQYTDVMLRAFFQPGDFIWEEELQAAFPKETYWYLYGKLISKESMK